MLKATTNAIGAISPNHPSLPGFEQKIQEKENLEVRRKERTESSFEPIPEEEEREKLERMAKEHDVNKIYQTGLKEERKRNVSLKIAVFILTVVGGAAVIISMLYKAGVL